MKFHPLFCSTSALFLLFCFNAFSISSQEVKIPLLHAHDLNGKSWVLPNDLQAKKTLILVAFERQQQDSVNSWIYHLKLRSPKNKITWIEIPLLQNPWKLVAPWIHNGMRRGITEEALRSHVWTIYTNRSSFLKELSLPSAKVITILVVDKNGIILEKVSGDYTKDKAQVILKILHTKS